MYSLLKSFEKFQELQEIRVYISLVSTALKKNFDMAKWYEVLFWCLFKKKRNLVAGNLQSSLTLREKCKKF